VLVVGPVDTILRVLAALEGVDGNVRHVFVVVAVYPGGGGRIARIVDDLVTESFGRYRFIGVGELYDSPLWDPRSLDPYSSPCLVIAHSRVGC
jgi:hypothetical protein